MGCGGGWNYGGVGIGAGRGGVVSAGTANLSGPDVKSLPVEVRRWYSGGLNPVD